MAQLFKNALSKTTTEKINVQNKDKVIIKTKKIGKKSNTEEPEQCSDITDVDVVKPSIKRRKQQQSTESVEIPIPTTETPNIASDADQRSLRPNTVFLQRYVGSIEKQNRQEVPFNEAEFIGR